MKEFTFNFVTCPNGCVTTTDNIVTVKSTNVRNAKAKALATFEGHDIIAIKTL